MKRLKKVCALLLAASMCVAGCMTAFADDVVLTNDAAAKAADDASATQVADYKPATQSDDPNAVIATQDAIEKAAQTANDMQGANAGVEAASFSFPNAAGDTVLTLTCGMVTVREEASAALKQAVAAWNMQNAATLTATAASLLSDATTVNALNGAVYSINQSIKVGLDNDQYFSFLITTSQDTAGAHPNTTCQGVTMDATSGKILSWGDMTPYLSDYRTLVISEVEGSLAIAYGSNLLPEANSNVESMVNNGTIPWYLDANGMNFVFAPYTVLPYSYGVVTESISNVILQGYNIVK